jgi:hypothetical protein
LKNKNKLCPFIKLSVFYNSYLKTFWSHLVDTLTHGKTKLTRTAVKYYAITHSKPNIDYFQLTGAY